MAENINLEFYKVFYVVAKYLNITKASEVLYVSQPAVTQTIKKLEEQLGGKLFYRQSKGVVLTEEGQNLYNFIKDSLESLDNAATRFSQYANLEEGKIKIKAGSTVGKSFLYEKLSNFLKEYPNIQIENSGGKSDNSIEKLTNGDVDIVFSAMPIITDKANIDIHECYEDKLVIFATEEYLDGLDFEIETLEDLSKVKVISPKAGSNTRALLDKFFDEKEIKFKPDYEVTSSLARLQLALNGIGVAIGYEKYISKEVKEKKVKILDISKELPSNKIAVLTLKKEACSFATVKFLEYILEK